MNQHTLFILKPGFYDGENGPFYCPHAAAIEGFLMYNPEVETRVDVKRIGFDRPRKEIVALIGEENQGTPVLVLAEGAEIPQEAQVSAETGRAFIMEASPIAKFLSRDLGVMPPH